MGTNSHIVSMHLFTGKTGRTNAGRTGLQLMCCACSSGVATLMLSILGAMCISLIQGMLCEVGHTALRSLSCACSLGVGTLVRSISLLLSCACWDGSCRRREFGRTGF